MPPTPHPTLTPRQVVGLQLEAPGRNDDPDAGVASAANRRATGPVARFAALLRNPTDRPIYDFTPSGDPAGRCWPADSALLAPDEVA